SELVHLLQEHLSEHAEVKTVKVIRDNKGGVCAFVQCEDAHAAAYLLRTLHSLPPRPFFGRILRYELARALRTLLISYRSPNRLALSADLDDSLNVNGGQAVAVEPATAMRIYRHRNAKALVVLYNEEATELDGEAEHHTTNQDSSDAFSGEGVLLSPLRYDAETMQKLADAFGPVEHFAVYNPDEEGERQNDARTDKICPHPHDAPRPAGMDANIYEVKWNHRDDCVSALMTLRRVPHLSVSWAHHSSAFGPYHESRNSSPALVTSNFSPYTQHTRSHPRFYMGNGADYQRQGDSPVSSAHSRIVSTHSRASTAASPGDLSLTPGTTFAHSTPFLHAPASPVTPWSTKSPRWSPRDFPPLGDQHAGGHIFRSQSSKLWGDRANDEEETALGAGSTASDSPSSSLSVNASTPLAEPDADPIEDAPELTTSSSPVQSRHSDFGSREADNTPLTPEFSLSPITPLTPRTGHNFPQTPTSAISSTAFGGSQSLYDETDYKGLRNFTPRGSGRLGGRDGPLRDTGRELDPATIFVGGLEIFGTHVWTEAQLHSHFGRFGQIEDIQLVRPLNKRTAFAFIRFNNTEASARAVLEEHNRIYHGRHIRVQLRDNNPPQRSPWKYGRGRGRFHHTGLPRLHIDEGASQRDNRNVLVHPGQSDASQFPTECSSYGQNTYPMEPGLSSNSSSVTNTSSSQFDTTHDLSTTTAPSLTPPPSASSVGPSASATGLAQQYTMPNFGYYGPQPWIQAYPQYPYPVSLVPGYTGYPAPSAQQGHPTFGITDTGTSSAGTQSTWSTTPHIYKPMVPYMTYPLLAPGNEYSQAQTSQQPNMQPPLRPTGFIQGNQGTLIPVYHPEALNQYMSHAQHTDTAPPHVTAQTQHTGPWPGYPPLSMHPYTIPSPTPGPFASQDAQTLSQRGWLHSPAPFGHPGSQQVQSNNPPPYLHHAPPSGPIPTAPSFYGSYPGIAPNMLHHNRHNTPPPRRCNRRENYHRINPPRASPNRSQSAHAHPVEEAFYGVVDEST
ncbi:hypothetical protein B0H21DRAFT_407380, partial [Amylocystis lapponica]